MNLTGVFINCICVFFAAILGSLFKKGISEKIKNALMVGLGLCVLYIGISGISADTNIIILVLSVSIGALLGETVDFDSRFNQLGVLVQKKLPIKDENI